MKKLVLFLSLISAPTFGASADLYMSSPGAAIGGPVKGGTAGSVLFVDPTAMLDQDNANFFWDITNHRLGIGTNVPTAELQLVGGNIDIPATTSTTGQITQAGTPLLHTFGTDGTFFGIGAGNFTMTGGDNEGIGFNVLMANTSGIDDTGVGSQALRANTTGSMNFAGGFAALLNNTTGSNNMAVGSDTLVTNTTGSDNVAIGLNSQFNANASDNVTIGSRSGQAITSGFGNSCLGLQCLENLSTNMYNAALGLNAGLNSSGDGNTFLGAGADSTGAFDHSTAVGFEAKIGASHEITLGDSTDTALNVGIGTNAPAARLEIRDGHWKSTQTTPPAAAPTSNAGTGATCTVSGTDTKGVVTITMGTTVASGDMCTVTFNSAYNSAPVCTVTPATLATTKDLAGDQYANSSTTTLVIGYGHNFSIPGNADIWNYFCIE